MHEETRDELDISVVIPTLGRRDRLARTFHALEKQTVAPGSFEVIVVSDPSGEETADTAELVSSGYSFRSQHLVAMSAGASAARNAGWKSASSPIVLFLGDDILASPQLLEAHLEWHRQRGGPQVGVLGRVRWASEITTTPFMRWLEYGIQFDYPAIRGDAASWFNFYTANVSLPRMSLERVGGFDYLRFPFLYEDLDLGYRLHGLGFRLLYNRRARGEHLHPTTVADWRVRMAAVAVAERQWVSRYPEMPAYFYDKFVEAQRQPTARGRGRKLIRWIPPSFPLLGRKAWRSADVFYLQQLAPAFLDAWASDEAHPRADTQLPGRHERSP